MAHREQSSIEKAFINRQVQVNSSEAANLMVSLAQVLG